MHRIVNPAAVAVTLLVLLLLPLGTTAAQPMQRPLEECAEQAPYGFPAQRISNHVPICRTAYALMHDNDARIASWVVYTLRSDRAIGCFPRVNGFIPDPNLPRGQRAELVDYANSGFDTGHIANNADMSWDPSVARESFILSNAAPQIPALNRGAWRQLESAVRVWAYMSGNGGSMTIYAGSIYEASTARRIGPNRVVVPSAFYKIVVNNSTRQSLAFIFPHSDVNDFRSVQTTVARVEEATGIRFGIPDDRGAMHPVWYLDNSGFMAARRRTCAASQG